MISALLLTQQRCTDDTGIITQFRLNNMGHFIPAAGNRFLFHLTAHREQQILIFFITDTTGNGQRIRLKNIDEVAYVRFASVYIQFKDINTFMNELAKLLSEK